MNQIPQDRRIVLRGLRATQDTVARENTVTVDKETDLVHYLLL